MCLLECAVRFICIVPRFIHHIWHVCTKIGVPRRVYLGVNFIWIISCYVLVSSRPEYVTNDWGKISLRFFNVAKEKSVLYRTLY